MPKRADVAFGSRQQGGHILSGTLRFRKGTSTHRLRSAPILTFDRSLLPFVQVLRGFAWPTISCCNAVRDGRQIARFSSDNLDALFSSGHLKARRFPMAAGAGSNYLHGKPPESEDRRPSDRTPHPIRWARPARSAHWSLGEGFVVSASRSSRAPWQYSASARRLPT